MPPYSTFKKMYIDEVHEYFRASATLKIYLLVKTMWNPQGSTPYLASNINLLF